MTAQEPPRPPKSRDRPSQPLPPGVSREEWQAQREAQIRKTLRDAQEQATWLELAAQVQQRAGAPPAEEPHA